MKLHSNKITRQADFQERRENAMRPSCFLGYDHDRLGVYLLEREAFALAEVEFRRAVWLNPFEFDFKAHLAICMYRQGRRDSAAVLAREVINSQPTRRDMRELLRLIAAVDEIKGTPPPDADAAADNSAS